MKKINVLLLVFLTIFLLTACVPAAFVLGATAGGVVVADQRDLKTMVEDKKITYRVVNQLNSDPRLKKRAHIEVATFNRVVILVGQTETEVLRRRAYELVKGVPHLRRINNEIEVDTPITAATKSKDIWITTKVKTAMLAEKGLKSTQIKVVSENANVYLMGLVSHHQAELAINVARQLSGVQKVVTLFEYTGQT